MTLVCGVCAYMHACAFLCVCVCVCVLVCVHAVCVCMNIHVHMCMCMVLATSYIRDSDEFHIILLKVSVIACESRCRLVVPLPRTTRADSVKGFKFLWTMDLTHVCMYTYIYAY